MQIVHESLYRCIGFVHRARAQVSMSAIWGSLLSVTSLSACTPSRFSGGRLAQMACNHTNANTTLWVQPHQSSTLGLYGNRCAVPPTQSIIFLHAAPTPRVVSLQALGLLSTGSLRTLFESVYFWPKCRSWPHQRHFKASAI